MSCFAEAMEQPYTEDTTGGGEWSASSIQEATLAFLPRAVDLSGQLLSLSDFHALGVSLSYSSHVTELDLSTTGLNTDRVEALCAPGGLQHVHCLKAEYNPTLHGDGMATLANALGNNGQLLEINVSWCSLDINDCAALRHIVITNKNLNTLDLYWNTLSADALRSLQQTLASSQLRLLSLGRTSMGAEGARLIGEILIANLNLQGLILDDNPLGNHGATLLLECAKTAKALEYLSMDHVDADDGVVPSLLTMMQERASLLVIQQRGQQSTPFIVSLHGNNISTAALEHLASQLPPCSTDRILCGMRIVQNGEMRMQSLSKYFADYAYQGGTGDLNMVSMGIDQEGAAQVTAQIEHDRSDVEALQLGHNSFQDEGAVLLAQAISHNSTLYGLVLDSNNIGCQGFVVLSTVLVQSNTSLQWLELDSNSIFGGGESRSRSVQAETQNMLGKLLARSVGLKYLGLGQTGLGDDECGVVAAALAENTGSITFLSLDGNQISDRGSTSLAGGLEQNTRVHYLSLSNSQISQVGAAAILGCAEVREQRGRRLQRVWMAGNKVDASQLTGCMVGVAFDYTNCSVAMSTYL